MCAFSNLLPLYKELYTDMQVGFEVLYSLALICRKYITTCWYTFKVAFAYVCFLQSFAIIRIELYTVMLMLLSVLFLALRVFQQKHTKGSVDLCRPRRLSRSTSPDAVAAHAGEVYLLRPAAHHAGTGVPL